MCGINIHLTIDPFTLTIIALAYAVNYAPFEEVGVYCFAHVSRSVRRQTLSDQ